MSKKLLFFTTILELFILFWGFTPDCSYAAEMQITVNNEHIVGLRTDETVAAISTNEYMTPVSMTNDTVYTSKRVSFKNELKVLATIDFSEVYSGYDPETMFGAFTFQTYGDMNSDGIEDIVLSPFFFTSSGDIQDDSLTMFLFSSDQAYIKNGTLLDSLVYRSYPREGVIADFNGDNKIDYYGACHGAHNQAILGEQNILLLSTSKNTLKDVSYSNLPSITDFSHGADVADIDKDGDLDIFLVNNANEGNYFLINDGTGSFTKDDSSSRISEVLIKHTDYTKGSFYDVNNDTFPDLIFTAIAPNDPDDFTELYYNRIVYNDGNGGFFVEDSIALPLGGFGYQTITTNIDPIDLNNDGNIDFILSQSEYDPETAWRGQYHQVLINDGSGNFRDETATRIPYQNFDNVEEMFMTFPNRTYFADINFDGHTDIVVNAFSHLISLDNPVPTLIYINEGDGTFLPLSGDKVYSKSDYGFLGISLAPIDFDKDGDIDLIGLNSTQYSDLSLYGSKGMDVILFENEVISNTNCNGYNNDCQTTSGCVSVSSPSEVIADNSPTFRWNGHACATWYKLFVKDSEDKSTFSQWYDTDEVCSGTTCKVSPDLNLPDGEYEWFIKSWNTNTNQWYPGLSFTVQTNGKQPAKITLVSPADITKDTIPTFNWIEDIDSTWYKFYLQNTVTNTKFVQWYEIEDNYSNYPEVSCSSGMCSLTMDRLLETGNYTFWIKGWNDYGSGEWSEGMSFFVSE